MQPFVFRINSFSSRTSLPWNQVFMASVSSFVCYLGRVNTCFGIFDPFLFCFTTPECSDFFAFNVGLFLFLPYKSSCSPGKVYISYTTFLWEARVAQAVSALCLSSLKPSLVCGVSCERAPAVDLSFASRVFLRVLRFSSLSKLNAN